MGQLFGSWRTHGEERAAIARRRSNPLWIWPPRTGRRRKKPQSSRGRGSFSIQCSTDCRTSFGVCSSSRKSSSSRSPRSRSSSAFRSAQRHRVCEGRAVYFATSSAPCSRMRVQSRQQYESALDMHWEGLSGFMPNGAARGRQRLFQFNVADVSVPRGCFLLLPAGYRRFDVDLHSGRAAHLNG